MSILRWINRRVDGVAESPRWIGVILGLLIALICALLMSGCGEQRAQLASNARAGAQATQMNLGDAKAVLAALANRVVALQQDPALVAMFDQVYGLIDAGMQTNSKVTDSLPAVADVPLESFPKPAMTPEEIRKNPNDYQAPPAPKPGIEWGTVALAGTTALLILRSVGTMIPYIGPVIERFPAIQKGLDLLWHGASSASARTTDKAKTVVATHSVTLADLLAQAALIPEIADKIPPDLVKAVGTLAGRTAPAVSPPDPVKAAA